MSTNEKMNVMQDRNLQKVSTTARVGSVAYKTLTYAFLLIMALIVLFPFYWMIISSLKTLEEYRLAVPTFWPKQIKWTNYIDAFNTANLGSLFCTPCMWAWFPPCCLW